MDFGLNFFPAVNPEEESAEQFWTEALHLTKIADELGYDNVRAVEHYFKSYGGYSPNPLIFLTAAAMVTKKMKLITGAVLPVFNNPLKLAGEIGMVDAISHGRVQIGFARAFLPHEFAAFGRSMDESRARYNEGIDQVQMLLEKENVSSDGKFHKFENITSLPRPTQKPRPPFWVAAAMSKETFEYAGRQGHYIMAIPVVAEKMVEMVGAYRDAWKTAGHKGNGKVMFSFPMYCAATTAEADAVFEAPNDRFKESMVDGLKEWLEGNSSKDYPNYGPILAGMKAETYKSNKAKGVVLSGSPADIRAYLEDYNSKVPFDSAALNVKLPGMSQDVIEASIRLFAKDVMPHFK